MDTAPMIEVVDALPDVWRIPYELGFSVIPQGPDGVAIWDALPGGSWEQFRTKRASLDQVRQWALDTSNVGIITGDVSGIIVLSSANRGALAEAKRRGLPRTITARTPQGELQYFFRWPSGPAVRLKRDVLPGAELLCAGDKITAPGSYFQPRIGKSRGQPGGRVVWEDSPSNCVLADAPRWLVAEAEGAPVISATPYKRRDPSTIPPRRWVYGRQMLRGSLSVVVAPGAAGKTALQVGTAVALASGRNLLGKQVHAGPKRVWLWNLEDSYEELQRLIEAACKYWEIDEDGTGDRLLVNSALEGGGLCTAIEDRNGFKVLEPVMEALTAELIRCAVDVLIVDPFVSSHAVSENNNGAIDAIAKKWSRVAVAANCSIVLVHHTRKLNGAEATAEGSRGAGSLVNAARSALVLNKMSEAEAKKVGIPAERRRFYFRTYDDKNNRAPPAEASDWYELHSVSLENSTGLEVDSDYIPVVVPVDLGRVGDDYTNEQLFAVQDRIRAGDWKEHFQAKDWAGHAVAEVFGIDAEADRWRILQLLKLWTKDGWFHVIEKEDPKRREIKKYLVVGQWAKSVLDAAAEVPQGDLPNQD